MLIIIVFLAETLESDHYMSNNMMNSIEIFDSALHNFANNSDRCYFVIHLHPCINKTSFISITVSHERNSALLNFQNRCKLTWNSFYRETFLEYLNVNTWHRSIDSKKNYLQYLCLKLNKSHKVLQNILKCKALKFSFITKD